MPDAVEGRARTIHAQKTWLGLFLQDADDEARRRGDDELTADHLGLALTRSAGPVRALLVAAGVDQTGWRDQIVRVLAWGEARIAEREGRPMTTRRSAGSLIELRFTGTMAVDATVHHIVASAEEEAVANRAEVGPADLIVALLLEGECVAGGMPHTRCSRRAGTGPMVLCGGGFDDDLLARAVALAPRRSGRSLPEAVLVELGWKTRRTTREGRRRGRSGTTCRALESGSCAATIARSVRPWKTSAVHDRAAPSGAQPASHVRRRCATELLATGSARTHK